MNFISSLFSDSDTSSTPDYINSNDALPTDTNNTISTNSNSTSQHNNGKKEVANSKPFNLLILTGSHCETNWITLFKSCSVHGRSIKVYATTVDKIRITCYSTGTPAYIDAVIDNKIHTFPPHFCLIRSQFRGQSPSQDWRNILYGLQYANIPSLNSLHSACLALERPFVFGELLKIQRKLGKEEFPLVDQNYYANYRDMMIGPNKYPAVVKVGHAHAGMGKMQIVDHHQFEDFASVLSLTNQYCTAEPFYKGEYDLRIQKIGDHVRVFKRTSCGAWKTNTSAAVIEDVELTKKYKKWIDEASAIFGGMDLCALDAIHCADGKELILELNDSSIGLSPEHQYEDDCRIRDLVVQRMTEQISLPVQPQ